MAADRYNEGSDYEFVVRLTTPRQDDTFFDLNLSAGTSNGQGVDYTFTDNGPRSILAFQTEVTFSASFLGGASVLAVFAFAAVLETVTAPEGRSSAMWFRR